MWNFTTIRESMYKAFLMLSVPKKKTEQEIPQNPSATEDPPKPDAVIKLEWERPASSDVTVLASFHVALMAKMEDILNKLESITTEIETLQERNIYMALNLDTLTAEVTRARTVEESAITLLHELAAQIKANVDDPTALNGIVDQLKTSTDALASAVADSAGVTPMKTVILNADSKTEPTVAVTLPEVLPPVVHVEAEQVVPKVDVTSPEPQVEVTVEPAPAPVVAAVEAAPPADVANPEVNIPAPAATDAAPSGELATAVIETPAGQTDVTVTADAAKADQVGAATGVDPVAVVADAVAASPDVTAAPEVPAADAAPAADAPVTP